MQPAKHYLSNHEYMTNKLDYVTNAQLKKELEIQKYEILREVRVITFEAMETVKVHFEERVERHMTALLQGFRDELRVYKDGIKMFMDKLNNHESRICELESKKT
jgi:hypothetical protein